ncbi:type II secretion system minor pseudopilin GspJ [Sphingomonas bacterium]|uniref:type II secretion system minor pseudopilin GspJ n=1 Tax=Sphingomonas bacterium TaxID=1895847 RepID=UPI0020C71C8C|nr:type II secretion system minor pseudopilin GspJ [Sphingomonas bacterium]
MRGARRSAEHGFGYPRRSAEHGFTLVELMVAFMIFGILAAAGVALLGFSVRAQGAGAARLDDLSGLERTVAVLSADCAQALVRPVRDANGVPLPAFVGESGGGSGGGGGSGVVPMLRLVRGSWSNLDAAPRPSLQKVEYRVENGALLRIASPELDGAAPIAPAVLLAHVRAATLRYRYAGAWTDRWDGAGGVALPQAMELALLRDDGRTYRALFLVGTGYGAPPAATTPGTAAGTAAGTANAPG